MNAPADRAVDRLRAVVARELGLHVEDDAKRHALAALIARRGDAWIARLEARTDPRELRALAAALTVGETYFFRNAEQLRAMIDRARPSAAGVVRVLSAACSSGEEPYSIVMCAREAGVAVDVRAFDVNPDALARAARGRYAPWAMRETPPAALARWFRRDGAELMLDRSVREAVRFDERNLVGATPADDAGLWAPAVYDVVFCRNVLMYFEPAAARAVIDRITRALVPGGLLFLGHAETLRGLSDDYALVHSHGAFYYQRKPIATAPAAPDPHWIDRIAASADRVRALAELDRGQPPAPANVIADDELSAGAHYLRALCCEGEGDLRAAIEHDRAAAAIDPSFAMARLHLGLIARRRGDADGARRELTQAAVLLAHEDAARLDLFGDGFAREALIAMCADPAGRPR